LASAEDLCRVRLDVLRQAEQVTFGDPDRTKLPCPHVEIAEDFEVERPAGGPDRRRRAGHELRGRRRRRKSGLPRHGVASLRRRCRDGCGNAGALVAVRIIRHAMPCSFRTIALICAVLISPRAQRSVIASASALGVSPSARSDTEPVQQRRQLFTRFTDRQRLHTHPVSEPECVHNFTVLHCCRVVDDQGHHAGCGSVGGFGRPADDVFDGRDGVVIDRGRLGRPWLFVVLPEAAAAPLSREPPRDSLANPATTKPSPTAPNSTTAAADMSLQGTAGQGRAARGVLTGRSPR
jgi:hypothetical protein